MIGEFVKRYHIFINVIYFTNLTIVTMDIIYILLQLFYQCIIILSVVAISSNYILKTGEFYDRYWNFKLFNIIFT